MNASATPLVNHQKDLVARTTSEASTKTLTNIFLFPALDTTKVQVSQFNKCMGNHLRVVLDKKKSEHLFQVPMNTVEAPVPFKNPTSSHIALLYLLTSCLSIIYCNNFIVLITYMKKLLSSDWLRAVQLKSNTSAKSVIPVQKA